MIIRILILAWNLAWHRTQVTWFKCRIVEWGLTLFKRWLSAGANKCELGTAYVENPLIAACRIFPLKVARNTNEKQNLWIIRSFCSRVQNIFQSSLIRSRESTAHSWKSLLHCSFYCLTLRHYVVRIQPARRQVDGKYIGTGSEVRRSMAAVGDAKDNGSTPLLFTEHWSVTYK